MYRDINFTLRIFSAKKRKEISLLQAITSFIEITIFRLGEFLSMTMYFAVRGNLNHPLMIYVKKIGV